MKEVKIERGIPIAELWRDRSPKVDSMLGILRALANSEVGSSVFIPNEDLPKSIYSITTRARRDYGVGLLGRKVEGGHRIWRTS